MSKRATPHVPRMSDTAVVAKTGKNWQRWFAVLDKAGATKLGHAATAKWLRDCHELSGWWSQCITVEYELARGVREAYQRKSGGYSVSVTKTIDASLAELFAATSNAVTRRKWFPKGTFKPTSQTEIKYLNGTWHDARLNIGFYAKGAKAQIAIGIEKLTDQSAVEAERAQWKAALERLKKLLE